MYILNGRVSTAVKDEYNIDGYRIYLRSKNKYIVQVHLDARTSLSPPANRPSCVDYIFAQNADVANAALIHSFTLPYLTLLCGSSIWV